MKVVLALVIALAPLPAAAEALPVRLKDGAAWTLVVDHARDEVRAGKQTNYSSRSTYALGWRQGEGGVGRLTMTPVDFTPGPGSPAELAQAQLPKRPIVLEVDESLTPARIVNEADVRRDFERLLEGFTQGQGPEAQGMAKRIMDASFTTLVTRDLSMVALGQGTDLAPREPRTYEDSVPNPLGGSPIRAKGSMTLESYDRRLGAAVVVWRQSMDPASMRESVAAMVDGMLKDLEPGKRDEARTALATIAIDREDGCRFAIDARTGLATRAECTTQVKANTPGQSMQRTDRWTYTQTLPERR